MILSKLRSRLLIHQCTNESMLEGFGTKGKACYLGIDPTASSLHVGHLVGICSLKQLKPFYKPIILIGGATALIGDPSGKIHERPMLEKDFVDSNSAKLEIMVKKLLGSETIVVNNRNWYEKDLSALELLRDIGRHFRVSTMLSRDVVKSRLDSGDGLSFTELSYQILQAHDFLKLYENFDCQVQVGGSDQWGNIVGGVEYIQRIHHNRKDVPVGLTLPLVTVGGMKLGKTSGNVTCWLDAELTSDYDFFQYFKRLDDNDAMNMLYMLTDVEEIPPPIERQNLLAKLVTTFVRGETSATDAENLSMILFDKRHKIQDANKLLSAAKSAGVSSVKISNLDTPLTHLVMKAGLTSSSSEARRLQQGGGIYVNGKHVDLNTVHLTFQDFIQERVCMIRVGKAKWAIIEFVK